MSIDIGIVIGIIGILISVFFGLKALNQKNTRNNVSNNTNSGNGNQYNIGESADNSFKDEKK